MDEYYQEKEKEERKCIKTRRDIHSLLKIRTDGISGFVFVFLGIPPVLIL